LIRYFVLENKQIEPAKEFNYDQVTWCDLVKPSEMELIDVAQKFKVNFEDLEDCLDEGIRPLFTSDLVLGNQILILRMATVTEVDYDKQPTEPFGIIFTKDNKILTVHLSVPAYLTGFIDDLQKKQPADPFMMMLLIVHYLIDPMASAAQVLGKNIRALEKKVIQSQAAKAIIEPFRLNAYLIQFVTSMLGNSNAVKVFNHKNITSKEKDFVVLEKLDDILMDIEQVYSYSAIFRDSLANILDAYASVINNNLTSVMKVVGTLNLVIGVPTLVASVFGQNLFFGLPLPEDRMVWPFIVVSVITSAITLWIYLRFKKSNWV
jgi:magnesium transporter